MTEQVLVPWAEIAKAHRWDYALTMLRLEERRRRGEDLEPGMKQRIDRWLAIREADDSVVAYDPDRGFEYVPRRPEDVGLVRMPGQPVA